MVNLEILGTRKASSGLPTRQPSELPPRQPSDPSPRDPLPLRAKSLSKPTRLPGEIGDVDELKHLLANSSVIAFDAATRHGRAQTKDKLLDVGFAYFPAVPERALQNKLVSLEVFVEEFKPEIRFLRSHDELRRQEKFFWGQTETFRDAGEIVRVVEEMKARSSKNLMLAVFAHNTETSVIAHDIPEVAPYFSSWVDLQRLAVDMGSSELTKISPPALENVMYSLGLHDYKSTCHNSGNDALRTLGLLVSLVHISNTGQELRIIRVPKKPRPSPARLQPSGKEALPKGEHCKLDDGQEVTGFQVKGPISMGVCRGVKRRNPFRDINQAPKRRKIDVVETVRYERGGCIVGAHSSTSADVGVSSGLEMLQKMFGSFDIAE